jgi:hypothetical protein
MNLKTNLAIATPIDLPYENIRFPGRTKSDAYLSSLMCDKRKIAGTPTDSAPATVLPSELESDLPSDL